MTDLVQKVTSKRQQKKNFPEFRAGDTIGVNVKVKEAGKERVQLFKGVVIKVEGKGVGRRFTVRKISSGVGVERTFPFTSPAIEGIVVHSRGKVRRGKLYFLRGLKGRAARLTSELVFGSSSESKTADDTAQDESTAE
ncbi:MAG: 50S ribosomal protein L19 [Bdellovibrionaceae bacterium]|nr:50S ribosomal protein L19 [Pseudobdellovibrionaceae bacterium]